MALSYCRLGVRLGLLDSSFRNASSGTGTYGLAPTYNVGMPPRRFTAITNNTRRAIPREVFPNVPGMFAAIALFIKQLSLLVAYVKNNAFPQPLSEEEEALHLRLMAEGDQDSRNKLIEHNLRLVAHIVNTL